ncbi:hypothetical protein [Peribacillus asahii]|uniref:hypothetical protein n=1 Tax=Peribacillus asahii TaxID=228899 RepID=UPI00207AF451|nr:hypothetical protein [Peribacillus asahii]USK86160.1 hypothetical protein LIT35_05830 [Peribacillus asahii]
MAEISTVAYQDLRNYIQTNWKYIELQDEAGTPVVRLSPSDSRVQWTHLANDQTLKLQVVIKGIDSDITAPKTFTKSVIYNVPTGGSPLSSETFTPFTIESDQDELTVVHSISVPKVL